MPHPTAHSTSLALAQVQAHYLRQKAWLYALQGLGVLLPLMALVYQGGGGHVRRWEAIGICLLVIAVQIWRWQKARRQTDLPAVARHLNRRYPALEESTELLLQPEAELPLLAKLQRQRTESALAQIPLTHAAPVALKSGLLVLLSGAAIALGLWLMPGLISAEQDEPSPAIDGPSHLNRPVQQPKAISPAIKQLHIRIIPPAYTRKHAYAATAPSFKAEVGARVVWTVQTNQRLSSLQWVRGNQKPVTVQAVAGKPQTYTFSWTVTESALYHLRLNGQASDFYAIEAIDDEAPSIQIQQPKQYTEIEFGEPQRVTVQATLQDDYGLRQADLIATVAQGEGEAVKFREQRIPLQLSFSGQPRQAQVRQLLDLQKLGMSYGDELYFYLQAWDNHKGYTRTEAFFVEIEDTTVVEMSDDMSLGVNPKPEYFRSQRQIIIDTEKLIQEQKGLTQAVFLQRSNDIGAEQKLLRLRYGKFLGEEAETSIGRATVPEGTEEHHADDGHDHSQDLKKNESTHEAQMNELMDPYLHKHDQEEAATFFEPAIKAQLKGALAQMWEAELRLRTGRPKEALPFEYKALRLLKEVQQKSRAYVKKTGFDPPPLKEPEKRLTGDLSKIAPAEIKHEEKPQATAVAVRQAVQLLEKLKTGGKATTAEAALLERAGQELGKAALREPGQYLRALQDLRQLAQNVRNQQTACASCLLRAQSALHRFLPISVKTAQKPASSSAQKDLANSYFNRLN